MEPNAWTVEAHLAGQPASSVELYRRFVSMVEQCGPFSYSVTKTSITFKGSRRGFAGALPTRRGLSGYLDLQRVIEDRRVISVAPYTRRLFVHQIRLATMDDLDEQFRGWVCEAYAVGQGAHMLRPPPPPHGMPGPAGPIVDGPEVNLDRAEPSSAR
ncbi:MAG: DUF5655 domain-containing protein [Streptosporangiaceae bacterium]